MKVSVIVPARDAEPFLREALDSIFGNGCVPLEVIVVDDGSRDRTPHVAREYPVLLSTQPRRGVAASRNVGWRRASGELLAWLDADDRWPDGRLGRQLAALEDPKVDVVYGRVREFGSGCAQPSEPKPGRLPGSMLIRREVFEAVGGFDESLCVGEFMDWLVRASGCGVRERLLPDVCLERRIHEQNLGIVARDRRGDYLRVAARALARHRRDGHRA